MSVNKISIKNFKSIKSLEFDCAKVNVIIGAPNVGKSNILEAVSLFDVPLARDINQPFKGLVRFNYIKNLFFDNNSSEPVIIKIFDNDKIKHDQFLGLSSNYEEYHFLITSSENGLEYLKDFRNFHPNSIALSIINSGQFKRLFYPQGNLENIKSVYNTKIQSYTFNNSTNYSTNFTSFLLPPDGRNLVAYLNDNKALYSQVQDFFNLYGLEMVIDGQINSFEIQKREGNIVHKYPFELTADTLQRIIFYLAAIKSNKDCFIVFEEPETHSFPPYISTLAQNIILDETNQFLISTHSPYLLNKLISDVPEGQLKVHVAYYEDYQTKLHTLKKEDLITILDDSVDAFFNLDRFLSE